MSGGALSGDGGRDAGKEAESEKGVSLTISGVVELDLLRVCV